MHLLNQVLNIGYVLPELLFLGVIILIVIRLRVGKGETVRLSEGCYGSTAFDLMMFQFLLSAVGTVVALIFFPILIWQKWDTPLAYFLGASIVMAILVTAYSFLEIAKSDSLAGREYV